MSSEEEINLAIAKRYFQVMVNKGDSEHASGQPTRHRTTQPRAHGGTHRALVLHEHAYAMRPLLQQLLHDLGKVDRREEVAPRVVRDELDLLLHADAVGQLALALLGAAGGAGHLFIGAHVLLPTGEVEEAVAEEAT